MVTRHAQQNDPNVSATVAAAVTAAMAEDTDADPMGLVDFFTSPDFERMDDATQTGAIEALIVVLKERRAKEPIPFAFHPTNTTWQTIADLLALARESGRSGPVAHHLVGANLALRFPHLTIENLSYSTADDQLGRPGRLPPGRHRVSCDSGARVTRLCKMPAKYGSRPSSLPPRARSRSCGRAPECRGSNAGVHRRRVDRVVRGEQYRGACEILPRSTSRRHQAIAGRVQSAGRRRRDR